MKLLYALKATSPDAYYKFKDFYNSSNTSIEFAALHDMSNMHISGAIIEFMREYKIDESFIINFYTKNDYNFLLTGIVNKSFKWIKLNVTPSFSAALRNEIHNTSDLSTYNYVGWFTDFHGLDRKFFNKKFGNNGSSEAHLFNILCLILYIKYSMLPTDIGKMFPRLVLKGNEEILEARKHSTIYHAVNSAIFQLEVIGEGDCFDLYLKTIKGMKR